jgi:hypothetical protein
MSSIYIKKSELSYINFSDKCAWVNIIFNPVPLKILKTLNCYKNSLCNNKEICLNILINTPSKIIYIKDIIHTRYIFFTGKHIVFKNENAFQFIKDFNNMVKTYKTENFIFFVNDIKNNSTKLNNVFQLLDIVRYICDFM